MKIIIKKEYSGIEIGREVLVWHMSAFFHFKAGWYLGADSGEAIFQYSLHDVDITDRNLKNFVFLFDEAAYGNPIILHRVLAEDRNLYVGLVEFDKLAYAEFHRRRLLLPGES